MIREDCYWYSKEINDPPYCEYYKKYIDECEEECRACLTIDFVDRALRYVIRDKDKKAERRMKRKNT